MPKFRKKPVVIEAVAIKNVIAGHDLPLWAEAALESGAIRVHHAHHADPCVFVETLEGSMFAEFDDMLIQGVKGELYPCKPDIFAATYDAVDAAPPSPPAAKETSE